MKVIYKTVAEEIAEIKKDAADKDLRIKEILLDVEESTQLLKAMGENRPSFVGDTYEYLNIKIKVKDFNKK